MNVGTSRLNYYRLSATEVLEQLNTSEHGLTAKEAAERLDQAGPNTLHRIKRDPVYVTFGRQFKNLLVVMLLSAAVLSLYLDDFRTAIILILIAGLNISLGFFQEYKAKSLIQSLEQLMVPQAKVIRGGKLSQIDSTELVLGDVVYVEIGDTIPADLRIIDEAELGTNDFALTGESSPSRKFVHAIGSDVPLGNRHNLLLMSTLVATGTGHGVVIGTGMNTELGRIANLSQTTPIDTSPLHKDMNKLTKHVAQATVILTGILLVVAINADFQIHQIILLAVGITAAMIPSGLVAEVSIMLAQTAARMAKSRALVKKLSSIEALGATRFILTDKTGTLTKNEMTVEQILIGRSVYTVTGTGYEPTGEIITAKGRALTANGLAELELFFATGVLASNATVDQPDDTHSEWYVVGDPTEGAVVTLGQKAGIDSAKWNADQPEIKEFQFDSARKLMSSVRHRDDQVVVYVKGAPESLLAKSTDIWDHGHVRKLTDADREFFSRYNEQQADDALRNLAFGFRILPKKTDIKKLDMDEVEQDFIFLGIVSMIDPLRDEVPAAMKAAHAAHIKVSIITGDYPATAKAIARKAGLSDDITIVVGDELTDLADSQILQLVQKGGVVFSRVNPEDKLRIVDIIKRSGGVVAVTGDGVNDVPALKRADVGIAMGRSNADVAKESADIVLLDDSFKTLLSAVEQGRLTFRNIRKAARCALTDNAGELLVILISFVGLIYFHIPFATTAVQIIAIDIIAQILPITALGWDKASHNLMRDKPRKLKDRVLNKRSAIEFIAFGALAAGLAYANYLWFYARQDLTAPYIDTTSEIYAQATILTFLTLVLCQFMNLMLVRADEHESFFTSYLWSNKKLLTAFGISFFCIFNIMYNPWIQPYFGAGPLSFMDWMTAILCAGIYLCVRLAQRHTRKHTRHAVLQLHREVYGNRS